MLHEFQHQQIDKNDLDRQDHRQADVEFGVLGFVAEEVHTGDGTDAAADSRNTHQRRFRDTPEISFGFILVRKHKQEAERID